MNSKKYLESKLDYIEYLIGDGLFGCHGVDNTLNELVNIRKIINVQLKSHTIDNRILYNALNRLQHIENLFTAFDKLLDILGEVSFEMEDLLEHITKWNQQYNVTDLKPYIKMFCDIIYPNKKIIIYPNIESESDFDLEFDLEFDKVNVEELKSMYEDTQTCLKAYKSFISKICDIHKHPLSNSFPARHDYRRSYLHMILYVDRLNKVISLTPKNFSEYTTIFTELLNKQDKGKEFKKLVKDPVFYLTKLESARTNALILANKERLVKYESICNDAMGMVKTLDILRSNLTKMDLCADIYAN